MEGESEYLCRSGSTFSYRALKLLDIRALAHTSDTIRMFKTIGILFKSLCMTVFVAGLKQLSTQRPWALQIEQIMKHIKIREWKITTFNTKWKSSLTKKSFKVQTSVLRFLFGAQKSQPYKSNIFAMPVRYKTSLQSGFTLGRCKKTTRVQTNKALFKYFTLFSI